MEQSFITIAIIHFTLASTLFFSSLFLSMIYFPLNKYPGKSTLEGEGDVSLLE
jgi:hypothetical protein